MLRTCLAFSLAVTVAAGLTACGKDGDLSDSQAQIPTGQPAGTSNIATEAGAAAAAANAAAPTGANTGGYSDGNAQAAYNAANPPPTPQ